MIAIRTVVCPVDFSPATTRQVDLASDVCRAFGARLILHHNVSDLSVGAAVGWMWHADHEPLQPDSVDERMRNLISSVPAGVDVEGCVTARRGHGRRAGRGQGRRCRSDRAQRARREVRGPQVGH